MRYFIKIVLFLVIIIYPFIIPPIYEMSDPCGGTTVDYLVNYSGIYLLIIYPLVVTTIIYFWQTKLFVFRIYAKLLGTVLKSLFCLFCFFLLNMIVYGFIESYITNFAMDNNYFRYFLEYDCRNEIVAKQWMLDSFCILSLLFCGVLVALNFKYFKNLYLIKNV